MLALSSASGTAPFDALRRYVELLTGDGRLDVELDIDPTVRLAPDEQIEIFRIVQEGLPNARRHAGAGRADVTIATVRADASWSSRTTASASTTPSRARASGTCASGPHRSTERFSLRSLPGRDRDRGRSPAGLDVKNADGRLSPPRRGVTSVWASDLKILVAQVIALGVLVANVLALEVLVAPTVAFDVQILVAAALRSRSSSPTLLRSSLTFSSLVARMKWLVH